MKRMVHYFSILEVNPELGCTVLIAIDNPSKISEILFLEILYPMVLSENKPIGTSTEFFPYIVLHSKNLKK